MRIRTKTWARPELDASNYFAKEPTENKGNWGEMYEKKSPIHLDLGCGKCTFLAELAYKNPDVNYLAVDISFDILGVARRNITEKFGEKPVDNVILTSYNIEKITDFIGNGDLIERIYINFCNPWPSARHHKRRLTHTRQLFKYKEILAENGEIWFKTDNYDLYLATKRYMTEIGMEIFFDTTDLFNADKENIQSEHEVKFESQGIKTKSLRARFKKDN